MNISFKSLKEEIIFLVEEYYFIQDTYDLKNRILDILKNFVHLKYSFPSAGLDTLKTKLEKLKEFLGSNIERYSLRQSIEALEKDLVNFLVFELRYPEIEFNEAYETANKKANKKCVSEYLQEILIDNLQEKAKSAQNFEDFWTVGLETIITEIFCIQDSLFIKNFCSRFISEAPTPINASLPIMEKACDLIKSLCSNKKDFKFLYKANYVYQKVSSFSQESKHKDINSGIEIRCTFCPPYATCTEKTISVNKVYQMSTQGLNNESSRNDGLVLFGKHKFADIILPENSLKVEDLSFAIYSNGIKFEMIDCSKSSVKFNMIPYFWYPIHEGSIFDIATKTIIHIKARQNFENENIVHSKLLFEHCEGWYSTAIEREKCITTYSRYHNKTQYSFILGRGGEGIPVDIYCNINDVTGRKHLKFIYHEDNWYVVDMKSKNRTYFFLKDFSQRKNKEHSRVFPVFTEYRLDEEAVGNDEHDPKIQTLIIGHYIFLIRPFNIQGSGLQ